MSVTLTLDHLTKRFGDVVAVDGLSATVKPGTVTALLGPNGAGKSTTMRMLLGLVHATSGSATFDGQAYGDLVEPARRVVRWLSHLASIRDEARSITFG